MVVLSGALLEGLVVDAGPVTDPVEGEDGEGDWEGAVTGPPGVGSASVHATNTSAAASNAPHGARGQRARQRGIPHCA